MRNVDFPVAIDVDALAHLKSMIARKGSPGDFIRIGVKGGGCSGLEYVVRIDQTMRETDLRIDEDSLTVVCDPKSAEYLRGSTLKLSGNLIGGGLVFENPNAQRSCGCGTSFLPATDPKH